MVYWVKGMRWEMDGTSIINSPIENPRRTGKGEPWAIQKHHKTLNNRQQALLDKLPEYDSSVVVRKSDVSMTDLAALTAKTDVEFAMFTKKGERLILRGDAGHVNINEDKAKELNRQGYKWSGHTHTGDSLVASHGDKRILGIFAQKTSVVYNALGEYNFFGK